MKKRPTGNRFLEYTLYPMANVSLRSFDGKGQEFVVAVHLGAGDVSTGDVAEKAGTHGQPFSGRPRRESSGRWDRGVDVACGARDTGRAAPAS